MGGVCTQLIGADTFGVRPATLCIRYNIQSYLLQCRRQWTTEFGGTPTHSFYHSIGELFRRSELSESFIVQLKFLFGTVHVRVTETEGKRHRQRR